jgi:hypothetical protein
VRQFFSRERRGVGAGSTYVGILLPLHFVIFSGLYHHHCCGSVSTIFFSFFCGNRLPTRLLGVCVFFFRFFKLLCTGKNARDYEVLGIMMCGVAAAGKENAHSLGGASSQARLLAGGPLSLSLLSS